MFMDEGFTLGLARKFAPTYRASEKEKCYLVELEQNEIPRIFRAYPPWNPFVCFSALQLHSHDDVAAYEINYLTIWDQDTGISGGVGGHEWDTERTALLVTGSRDEDDPEAYSAKEAYYAAHEGVSFVDKSTYYPCRSEKQGVTVYWSEGKHASYPRHPREFSKFERFKSPGLESKAGEYVLLDVGTVDDPRVLWVLHKQGWGPTGEVKSVHEKLRKRLWDRETWQRTEKPPYTEKQVRRFQEIENLPVIGEVDEVTMKAIRAKRPPPSLIRNMDKFSDTDIVRILQSTIAENDIEVIAKKNLSSAAIEKIIRNNLRGTALKDYIKLKKW